jgi:hypothetical protein
MGSFLLLAPFLVQYGYALSNVPSKTRLVRLGKREECLRDQHRGVERSKIATNIRSRLEVLKRDIVKIVLV